MLAGEIIEEKQKEQRSLARAIRNEIAQMLGKARA